MSEELKKRTKKFALDVIKLSAGLSQTLETRHAIGQVIRSSSSKAANYRSTCRAKSKADFISKFELRNGSPFNVNAMNNTKCEIRSQKCENRPVRQLPFYIHHSRHLWIQLFYSAPNEKGRAGFVMATTTSDARSSEQELRKILIESRAVDVMVAVGANLFYTATLKEIEAQGWSLNPGRYVGVAAGEAVSDEDFKEQLETLNAQARDLEQTIVIPAKLLGLRARPLNRCVFTLNN